MPTPPRPAEDRRVVVTGTAGFVGFHLASLLLDEGFRVDGFDGMSDYYDVALKRQRHARLMAHPRFRAVEGALEDAGAVARLIEGARPDAVVHLAAQAGVRHSHDQPRTYLEANVMGTFNVMQAAAAAGTAHLLMASTSSAYGASTSLPLAETQPSDHPLSVYAATKKATEALAHAWANGHDLPITQFRLFTVYGPWGRPDMAYFAFAEAIAAGRPIRVHGHGRMARDFTYVGDVARAIRALIDVPPPLREARGGLVRVPKDSLSPVAPWRLVNIGNADRVPLGDFIAALERELGMSAIREPVPMPLGEAPETWADVSLLTALTGYAPSTDYREGLARFVDWWRDWRSDRV